MEMEMRAAGVTPHGHTNGAGGGCSWVERKFDRRRGRAKE